MDRHRLAEQRSLAAHRLVAQRVRTDPSLVDEARARLERWVARGSVSSTYAARWSDALGGPLEQLLALLVGDDQNARAMRQVSPFAGVLSPRERWTLWREVASRAGNGSP